MKGLVAHISYYDNGQITIYAGPLTEIVKQFGEVTFSVVYSIE